MECAWFCTPRKSFLPPDWPAPPDFDVAKCRYIFALRVLPLNLPRLIALARQVLPPNVMKEAATKEMTLTLFSSNHFRNNVPAGRDGDLHSLSRNHLPFASSKCGPRNGAAFIV